MTHTNSTVLNAAADYIETHGHLTGEAGSDGGPRCTMGALFSVGVASPIMESSPYLALRAYLRNSPGNRSGFVGAWNDEHTAAEVIEVLRATALIEAARESAAVRDGMNHQTVPQDEFNRLPKLYPDTKAEPDPHTNMVYAVIGDTEYATELAEVCS